MISFAISTLGCKVNAYESQGYAQALENNKYVEVDFHDVADIYIINTCAVTNTASVKSRKKIHQAITRNPDALIVVVGCYVQVDREYLKREKIDVLIGSDQKDQLVARIEEAINMHTKIAQISDLSDINKFDYVKVDRFKHQTRAYLKIQDGCNQFCSYCIIPYARGQERSLDIEQVIQAAKKLALSHCEIVLTGIHTGRYGRDLGTSLYELLIKLLKEVPDLKRIRISSIEMNEVDEKLLELMSGEKRIAKHLHIPIQSGSDDILKAMNRPYTIKEFEDKLTLIRSYVPNISISSDVIVGFPQESDEHFRQTYEMLKRNAFSFLHVFPYSKRDNTVAASLDGQLANDVKKMRVKELLELSNNLQANFMRKFIDKKVNVIWEKAENNAMIGHSSEYLLVKTDTKKASINTDSEVIVNSIEIPYANACGK